MEQQYEKYAESMRRAVMSHCSEPLLAVGLLRPRGTFSRAMVGRLTHSSKRLARRRSGGADMALCAVTENTIAFYEAKWQRGSWSIQKELAAWPRDRVRVEASKAVATCPIVIHDIESGEHYEFEGQYVGRANRHLTDALLEVLAPSVSEEA